MMRFAGEIKIKTNTTFDLSVQKYYFWSCSVLNFHRMINQMIYIIQFSFATGQPKVMKFYFEYWNGLLHYILSFAFHCLLIICEMLHMLRTNNLLV